MIHLAVANRYVSVREDGRRVEMLKIRCQPTRVQVPKKDDWSYAAENVNCHECLKLLIDDLVRKASVCMRTMKHTCYVKPTGFHYPKFVRGQVPEKEEIDPEILKRIEVGI